MGQGCGRLSENPSNKERTRKKAAILDVRRLAQPGHADGPYGRNQMANPPCTRSLMSLMDITPSLGAEDMIARHLEGGLAWIEAVLGKKAVAARLERQSKLRGVTLPEMFDTISAGAKNDLFGWNLFNCYAFLHDPPSYDTNAGARIVPTVVALGARAPLLDKIPGAADRLKASAAGAADFEKTAFEILIASAYAASGWSPEFLKPTPPTKTPDLQTTIPAHGNRVYVECKRLAKNSGYAQREREKWMALIRPIADYMRKRMLPILLDIVFHREIIELPDDYLAKEILPKLELAVPGVLIDSLQMMVSLRNADLGPIQNELKGSNIKTNGSRIHYLIFGSYDPSRGYHPVIGGQQDHCHPLFMKTIDFAAGAVWSCDAARSYAAKARDIRAQLAEAVDQLPVGSPGAVHLAVESYDGPVVEHIRNQRIANTLSVFKTTKDLRAVYIHLLRFESPPDITWDMQETVYPTSFAVGSPATAKEHENSPYLLRAHHAWTFDGNRTE